MKNKILWITQTALMLALLIVLQWATKPLGQIVTGSCVNAVLAMAALIVGMGGGLTVALLSPVFAYLLGIAPNLVTVPAIMAGNAVYVVVLVLALGRSSALWRKAVAWLAAAIGKFAVLYLLVVVLICGVLAQPLTGMGIPVAAKVLTVNFSWPQLITALIGGAVAMLIAPIVKKALRR